MKNLNRLVAMFAALTALASAHTSQAAQISTAKRKPAESKPLKGASGGDLNCPYKMNGAHNAKPAVQRVAEVEKWLRITTAEGFEAAPPKHGPGIR